MDKNSLYEAIFKRKSIRDYEPTEIDSNRLEEISRNLHSLKPLLSGIKTEFKIISPNQVTRKLGNKAPHFIAAFSEAKDAYKVNIGFMLQQMDLYFSATGLGSCWLGIPQPTKEVNRLFKSGIHYFDVVWAFKGNTIQDQCLGVQKKTSYGNNKYGGRR